MSSVLLVTAGSRGIGAACVRAFQAAGWNVSTVALAPAQADAVDTCSILTIYGDITDAGVCELAVNKTLSGIG